MMSVLRSCVVYVCETYFIWSHTVKDENIKFFFNEHKSQCYRNMLQSDDLGSWSLGQCILTEKETGRNCLFIIPALLSFWDFSSWGGSRNQSWPHRTLGSFLQVFPWLQKCEDPTCTALTFLFCLLFDLLSCDSSLCLLCSQPVASYPCLKSIWLPVCVKMTTAMG